MNKDLRKVVILLAHPFMFGCASTVIAKEMAG